MSETHRDQATDTDFLAYMRDPLSITVSLARRLIEERRPKNEETTNEDLDDTWTKIEETKRYIELMNGQTWLEAAIKKADRRLVLKQLDMDPNDVIRLRDEVERNAKQIVGVVHEIFTELEKENALTSYQEAGQYDYDEEDEEEELEFLEQLRNLENVCNKRKDERIQRRKLQIAELKYEAERYRRISLEERLRRQQNIMDYKDGVMAKMAEVLNLNIRRREEGSTTESSREIAPTVTSSTSAPGRRRRNRKSRRQRRQQQQSNESTEASAV